MKVYIAFSDSYESRKVVGVYTNKKEAENKSNLEDSKLSLLSRGTFDPNFPDVEEHELIGSYVIMVSISNTGIK